MADKTVGQAFPAPPDRININEGVLAAGTHLFRLHRDCYRGNQFNDFAAGDARFSPIRDRLSHQIIPTLYAAASSEIALCEVLFHDIDISQKQIVFDQRKLLGLQHSDIVITHDLRIAQLDHASLIKMRVGKRLIHCDAAEYADTRLWAEHIHEQHPQIQGMSWPSRQYQGQASVLFADRIVADGVTLSKTSALIKDKKVIGRLLQLAARMDIVII
ncbi:hypothetical protein BL250_06960 [Erwinia sp. OLTSP20]|uniref:RES family NAD+ phosphorylase n=1 Tax=unclassified Erwinia TaxID=2622719 RepID=UPI000C1A3DCF|nr:MULTISPECIES: RES family NAD+ phosphorylase [unclassified Erwinia]PIJ50873.1 hypothetical protein BV501_06690 [Erwinia sp. OAMSP11]PIJ73259.1 hypothetical protein BK416_07355 [Erwinia sp. OLSSP12]PIJ82273.1 hypothetical protein BLD47_06495 [Erwinia sp. OLCASP19]PIJ85425.1 hypothetical protein BLD46_06255 [Erwinia sp. OLMTSP26]PIJ87122.1 hypothetical protein BLD49_06910 [Erwinia sp. OLMDSP33]